MKKTWSKKYLKNFIIYNIENMAKKTLRKNFNYCEKILALHKIGVKFVKKKLIFEKKKRLKNPK